MPRSLVELIVAIPARDEAETIVRCLTALSDQRNVDPRTFDVVLLANNCTDDTARRARQFPHVDVIDVTFGRAEATVGRARGTCMDIAARRFAETHIDGIIATTDADTIVDPYWVANTFAAIRDVDAVAGMIDVLRDDFAAMPQHTRLAYERMRRYAGAVAQLESTLDPTWWDPPPRHPDHFGASFAVRASAYRTVGGVPDCERLEDLALYLALLRADFRVCHSANVRVVTSGRRAGRVTGGLASFLDTLSHDDHQRVEHPQTTIENVRARAALRRYVDAHAQSDLLILTTALNVPTAQLLETIDAQAPFGRNWEAVEKTAAPYRKTRNPVDVNEAITALTIASPSVIPSNVAGAPRSRQPTSART